VRIRGAIAALLAPAIAPAAVARAAPALDCPAGTRQQRQFYADEFWCARPDGTRHGPYRNGWTSPIEAGAYRDGKRDGWWRRWSGGVLVDERRYDRDRADGRARTWSDKGVLLSDGVMSRGEKVGLWREWHQNGHLASTGHYRRGQRVGRHRTWTIDGDPASDGRYHDDEQQGLWVERDDYGETGGHGSYRRGKYQGRWTFTYEGKRRAVGSFRNGLREGAWTFYWDDGSIKERGRYRRGRRDGAWTFHDFEKHDALSAGCREGEPHGRVVWRSDEGGNDVPRGFRIVAHFARGSLDGPWTERYPAGTRADWIHRGLYRDGLLVRGEELDDNPLGIEDGDALRLCSDDDDLPGQNGQ
jgi:antitoxin component YwqK of YwqJK toxin-antitoxin module